MSAADQAVYLGAAEAARRIARGALSAHALAEACVARATAHEAQLHAWAHLAPDVVIDQARALDAQTTPKGVLHGVPVAGRPELLAGQASEDLFVTARGSRAGESQRQ